MTAKNILSSCQFGARVAEDELENLEQYFVETALWSSVFLGEVDIIYGAKGTGKSAVYSLLFARRHELFNRGIELVSAEKPRGTPVFRSVHVGEMTEAEWAFLWRLYFLTLVNKVLQTKVGHSKQSEQINKYLVSSGLAKPQSLGALLQSLVDYVKRCIRLPSGIESTIAIDHTGAPSGVTGRITFSEPTPDEPDHESVWSLLQAANSCLISTGISVWLLFDRLDVAFADSPEIEAVALRSLFRAYLDCQELSEIELKIFLRSDIWERIVSGGFREASHITRSETIKWDRDSMLNLLIRRVLMNPAIASKYAVLKNEIFDDIGSQYNLFYRIFPEQIDEGPNFPKTFDWMLNMTVDGSSQFMPREMIHLLNESKRCQLRQFEIGLGDDLDQTGLLFSVTAIRDALKEVSHARLSQTLYAEHPSLREKIERFRNGGAVHSLNSIRKLFSCKSKNAESIAKELATAGFFAVGGEEAPYWIPFVYHHALGIRAECS